MMNKNNIDQFISAEDSKLIIDLQHQIDSNEWEISKLYTRRDEIQKSTNECKEKICKIKNKAALLLYANCPHEFELTITGSGGFCNYRDWCEHGREYELRHSYSYMQNNHHNICKLCGLVEGQPINITSCTI